MRLIQPTKLTWAAAIVTVAALVATAAYVVLGYDSLPDLLAVHFNRAQHANGWQYKTWARALTPVFIQAALGIVAGAIAILLLSRAEPPREAADDVRAAAVAAEAVVLFATIWIVFQVYVALALFSMWQRARAGLGAAYVPLVCAAGVLTIVVAARAQARIGAPAARPFVAEHWRLRHLYRNPSDPALFVPTRDGGRWTLNFGRPVAAVIMTITLLLGIVVPTVVLQLLLR